MACQYEIFYPGVYSDEEKRALEKFDADLAAGRAGREMVGDPVHTVTREELQKYARLWNPYNPLFNDETYAKKAGFADLPAVPGEFEAEAWFAGMPRVLGIWGLGLSEAKVPGRGHDCLIECYRDIFPGDVLTTTNVARGWKDVTDPNGSAFRAFRIFGQGEAYNQRGELVLKSDIYNVEIFKRPLPGETPEGDGVNINQGQYRPVHRYTDEDWGYIKSLWAAEKIRGDEPLYWEDVNIGDEPVPTCDGPYTDLDMFIKHGEGLLSMPSVRDAMTSGDRMFMWAKDPYGLVYQPIAHHLCGKNMPGNRPLFYNFTGRAHAARMITNWIGDRGFVSLIGHKQVSERPRDDQYNAFPETYDRASRLSRVPHLKKAGKFLNIHGMSGDLCIAKGYVCDKYVKDGRHVAELACWVENIEGDILQDVPVNVVLPSRNGG